MYLYIYYLSMYKIDRDYVVVGFIVLYICLFFYLLYKYLMSIYFVFSMGLGFGDVKYLLKRGGVVYNIDGLFEIR